MLKTRVMTPDDWDGVAEVWKNHEGTNPVDDSPEGFTKYLRRNPTTSFVAVDDGRIIGTILAGHDGRRGIFHHVSVLPEYQKQGLAKEIMYTYCRREQARGRKRLILTCLPKLVKMYAKMGFRDRGMSASVWGGEAWHEMDIRLNW